VIDIQGPASMFWCPTCAYQVVGDVRFETGTEINNFIYPKGYRPVPPKKQDVDSRGSWSMRASDDGRSSVFFVQWLGSQDIPTGRKTWRGVREIDRATAGAWVESHSGLHIKRTNSPATV
jgi:hypothetical protein